MDWHPSLHWHLDYYDTWNKDTDQDKCILSFCFCVCFLQFSFSSFPFLFSSPPSSSSFLSAHALRYNGHNSFCTMRLSRLLIAGLGAFLELFKQVLPRLPIQVSNETSFEYWAGEDQVKSSWGKGREILSTENSIGSILNHIVKTLLVAEGDYPYCKH